METLEAMEMVQATELEQEAFVDTTDENNSQSASIEECGESEISALKAALLEANIRAELLLAGTAKENLSEAQRLAAGLCGSDEDVESAVSKILSEYPHLKAVRCEIPQLSAQTSGSADGFALIKSIFAKR